MKLPEINKRSRIGAICAIVFCQALIFGFYARSGPQLVSDNVRYEQGGWAIASGKGLVLPFSMAPDPVVRGWVCDRHPTVCEDGTYPSAQYPPGYQYFLGGLYFFTGRSLWAIGIAHLLLLWGTFVCAELLAARFLQKTGYWFVVALAATYPFLARQATFVMADTLHAFLLMASVTALLLMMPGLRRGLLFGFLFGAATFVRTYSIVILPFLFGWPRIKRAFSASRKEWLAAVAICVLPFVLWTARNGYWFGRFIPFSTTGLGAMVYLNKLEVEIGESYDEGNAKKIYAALYRNGDDPANYVLNKELTKEGLDWMKANPGTVAVQMIGRVPRLWISKGQMRKGVSAAYPFFIVYMGGLWVLGLAGMWLKRKDGRLNAVMLVIVLYWLFLVQTPVEARRTLALRLPMLLFAGFAVEEAVRRWRERKARALTPAAVESSRPEAPQLEPAEPTVAKGSEAG